MTNFSNLCPQSRSNHTNNSDTKYVELSCKLFYFIRSAPSRRHTQVADVNTGFQFLAKMLRHNVTFYSHFCQTVSIYYNSAKLTML